MDVTLLALPARLATRQMDNALAKTASPASRVTGDDHAGQITKYLKMMHFLGGTLRATGAHRLK